MELCVDRITVAIFAYFQIAKSMQTAYEYVECAFCNISTRRCYVRHSTTRSLLVWGAFNLNILNTNSAVRRMLLASHPRPVFLNFNEVPNYCYMKEIQYFHYLTDLRSYSAEGLPPWYFSLLH